MNNNSNYKKPDDSALVNGRIVRLGTVMIAIAVILFCFSYTKVETLALRIVLYVLAVALACIGAFFIVMVVVGSRLENSGNNFFLYDKKKKQNMPVESLTVDEIRDRLQFFMSAFKYRGKIYVGDLFSDRIPCPECIKTLFCYELLCQITEIGRDEAERFLSFGLECADVFTKYLAKSEDYELALKIRIFIIEQMDGKQRSQEFLDYLTERKAHFEEKMLGFTVKNIEKFT